MLKKKALWRLITLLLLTTVVATGLAGCQNEKASEPSGLSPDERKIVDNAGRELNIPAEINKVFCTSPVGTVVLYSLAPEKLVGWNYELNAQSKKYLLDEYKDLPNLGGWYAKASCNAEEILKIAPDIILLTWPTDVSLADKIQNQLGIPVIVVNSSVKEMDSVYLFMGDILGEKERAQELAQYCAETINDVEEKKKNISDEEKISVYYAEGPDGLQTDPKGTMFSEVLDFVGGENVANVASKGGMGLTPVSLEQVLDWNPDIIITWNLVGAEDGSMIKAIMSDSKWQGIKAVDNERVYQAPEKPFSWFGRLPSANHIIGIKWAANLLYPDIYKYDIDQEVKDFYAKFYHYDLSDADLEEILYYAR